LVLVINSTAFIVGRGGDGGTSGSGFVTPGLPGGPALLAEYPIDIANNGVIGGGGGGGGGAKAFDGSNYAFGGGGAGRNPGTGPGPASDGSLETGGVGAIDDGFIHPGDGGDLGQAGQNGDVAGPPNPTLEQPGGAAGPAVDGDSLVTWTTLGDVRGSRIN